MPTLKGPSNRDAITLTDQIFNHQFGNGKAVNHRLGQRISLIDFSESGQTSYANNAADTIHLLRKPGMEK